MVLSLQRLRTKNSDTAPTIAQRLLVLVAISILPILTFSVLLAIRDERSEHAGYEAQMLATAHALSLAVDREIAAQQATITALSRAPELQAGGDLAAFYERARSVAAVAPDTFISLIDPAKGEQLINTAVPFGTKLPSVLGMYAVSGVAEMEKPGITNLFPSQVLHANKLGVTVPVFRDGHVVYILGIAFDPSRISGLLAAQQLNKGWIASVQDGNHTLIARSRDAAKAVGLKVVQNDSPTTSEEGITDRLSFEGQPLKVAFYRSPLSGWIVGLGVELDIFNATFRRSLWELGVGGGALTAAALLLAYVYGRRISDPVAALSAMASSLGRSERMPSGHLPIREAQEVADQLHVAATLLGQRAQERAALLASLEDRVAERTRELEQSEARAAVAAAEAEAANRAKSVFLASMSHELRSPLNAVLGFAQFLLYNKKEPLTERQQESIDYILRGGNQLLELINDILDLAKIEAGGVSVSIEPVDVDALLDDLAISLRSMAQKKGIALTIDSASAGSAMVLADSQRLLQVLTNLGSNAIKYNRPNGAVHVGVGYEDRWITISVTDTGQGIPPDRQGEVFQPFNRLGAEGSTIEGTGIGLSISRNLMVMMKGRIGFESEPGHGSRFWVTLPKADRALGG